MGPGAGPAPSMGPWSDLDFQPVVGAWAEYSMASEGMDPQTVRMAIVGKEGDDFWYETVTTDHEGVQTVVKMLVAGHPSEQDNLKRMITKSGDEPALEVPIQMMQMQFSHEDEPEPDEVEAPSHVDLGTESVTVPAGTFEAKHWQSGDEDQTYDLWVNTGVGPYGIIKSSSDDHEMVLVAHGEDAKSLITEEPEPFEMPGFKMPGMGE